MTNSLLTAYFYSCTGLTMVIMRRCCDRKPVSGKISSIQGKKCENHTLIIVVDHKTCNVRMNLRLRSFGVIRIPTSDPRSVWIMVHQRNRRIMDSLVPLMYHDPDRSWITDPDPDHPKGTQP